MRYIILIFLISFASCQKTEKKSTIENDNKKPLIAKLEYKIESQLGEGAIWNYKTQEFYWIDIEGKLLHIYNPETKENRSFETPSRIGTVVPYTQNEAVVALEDGIYKLNINTGAVSLLSDVEAQMTENRFNDGKCDPLGNLWVGSMHLKQSKPHASLYKVNDQGEAIKMVDSVTISNGIVWTSDAKTMYYIDTPTSKIMAYDYDINTGTISNERVAVEVSLEDGYPDGMTIDSEDMLWVGLWNGNAIAHFNPKTGELMSKIKVPAHNITACAFGGENLDILYITTARIDMTPEELDSLPLSGSVFKVVPGVKGVKASFFGSENN